jgi:DNA-binding GntR family transcriptional regulator
LSQPNDVLPRLPDLKLIRDRVVDALRDAIIFLKAHHRRYDHFAFTRLGRNVRAVDEHEQIVNALRRRDLATVQHLLRAHLLRFYENVAPLLPVVSEVPDPPADT